MSGEFVFKVSSASESLAGTGAELASVAPLGGDLVEVIGGRRGRGVPVGRLLLTTLRFGGPADRVLLVGVVRLVPKATVRNVVLVPLGVGDGGGGEAVIDDLTGAPEFAVVDADVDDVIGFGLGVVDVVVFLTGGGGSWKALG